ncbi:MAG: hypothetical protein ACRD3J_14305, partial [Thermoanaerobaculia bacterium]
NPSSANRDPDMTKSSVTILILMLSSGCSSSTGSGGDGGVNIASAVGTYDGVSVNGTAFPLAVGNRRGCALTALGGTSTLTAAGRFTTHFSYHRQCGAVGTDINAAIAGSFAFAGSEIVFNVDSGFSSHNILPTATATLSGSTMTAHASPAATSVTLVLQRR